MATHTHPSTTTNQAFAPSGLPNHLRWLLQDCQPRLLPSLRLLLGAGHSRHVPTSTPQRGNVLGVPFPHYGQYGSVLAPPGTLASYSSGETHQGRLSCTKTVVSSSEWNCARGLLPLLSTIWVCPLTSRYSARVSVPWLPSTRTIDRSCCLSRSFLSGEHVIGILLTHYGQ